MDMKKSKYNILTRVEDNRYLITNLITGALATLDEQNYLEVLAILENPTRLQHTETYAQMAAAGFILPDEVDELNLIKKPYWKSRLNKRNLNLTVIPTFNCNLGCVYCYQKGFQSKLMSKDVAERIYQMVEKQADSLELLAIHWFGGEALLGRNIIEYLGTKCVELCTEHGIQYISSISTNGYVVDEQSLALLKRVGVGRIETTIAGTAEFHDALRRTRTNEPTFAQIIENIERAREDFLIILAVNITSSNLENIPALLEFLKEKSLVENVYLTLKQVESYANNTCAELALCGNTYSQYIVDMYKYAMQLGLNICDVTKFNSDCVYCSTDYERSYVVDPEGYIYKCVERYTEETREGYLGTEGEIVFTGGKNLQVRDVFTEEKCRDCTILPYCYGGCSDKRKRNLDFCPEEKEQIEEYLKLYYARLIRNS